MRRAAALSEPEAGVFVALVGGNGDTVLQRCCPINDPKLNKAELEAICEVCVCVMKSLCFIHHPLMCTNIHPYHSALQQTVKLAPTAP